MSWHYVLKYGCSPSPNSVFWVFVFWRSMEDLHFICLIRFMSLAYWRNSNKKTAFLAGPTHGYSAAFEIYFKILLDFRSNEMVKVFQSFIQSTLRKVLKKNNIQKVNRWFTLQTPPLFRKWTANKCFPKKELFCVFLLNCWYWPIKSLKLRVTFLNSEFLLWKTFNNSWR